MVTIMKITKHIHPLEYLVVENMYTEEELRLIQREIHFLLPKLKPPTIHTSAINERNEVIKQNKALFLDSVYADRSISDILTVNRKTFCDEILDAMKSLHPAFYAVQECNGDTTLLNYYGESNHYKPHRDTSQFTFLTFFIPDNKEYTGGDLILEGQIIQQKNNMMIGFIGAYEHEVTPIKLNSEDSVGRVSMSQFLFTKNFLSRYS